MRRCGVWWWVGGLVLLLCTPVQAGMRQVTLDQLPQLADYVVVGAVSAGRVRADARGTMLFTDYTLQVEEVVSGVAGAQIHYAFPGGSLNGRSVTVSHTPHLEPGVKYLLFGHHANYSVPLVGHEQGLFMLLPDTPSGEERVVDAEFRQIEQAPDGRLRRGGVVYRDTSGAVRPVDPPAQRLAAPPPSVVLGHDGQVLPQHGVVAQRPATVSSWRPLTRAQWVARIQQKPRAGRSQ